MTQNEGPFWRNTVQKKVAGRWERIESRSKPGFPDCVALIESVTVLVELKSKPTFMKGLGTTGLQRQFLTTWCRDGGRAFLLAQADGEVMLIWGGDVDASTDADVWRDRAVVYGASTRAFDWTEMNQQLVHYVPADRIAYPSRGRMLF